MDAKFQMHQTGINGYKEQYSTVYCNKYTFVCFVVLLREYIQQSYLVREL
jgi:hypothetical protein